MNIDLFPSRPGSQSQMLTSIGHVLNTRDVNFLRAGFAYVTVAGVNELLGTLEQTARWNRARKEFIVGIAQGITEPYALTRLLSLPHSQTRVFLPDGRLSKTSLYSVPTFHGKILACGASSENPLLIVASSANLTAAAIGPQPRNYEFGIGIVSGEEDQRLDSHNLFVPWWRSAWNHSRALRPAFINKYAELRKPFLRKNPALLSIPEVPENIAQATEFWIEVGKASGIQRHQVEFSESLVRFFGPVTRKKRILTLERGHREWDDRPLSHKVTTFGVEIWRLGMPTIAKGGYPIQDRIVRFQRTEVPLEFRFDVADAGSNKANQWETITNLVGHMGQTKGMHPRRYGFA